MKKTKVYIIGAVKGLPIEEVRANFQKLEDEINALGYEAVNPMKLGIPEDHTFEQCKDICYAALDPCEAVFVQRNWVGSKGSEAEIVKSHRTGKCIFYEQMNGLQELAQYVPLENVEA